MILCIAVVSTYLLVALGTMRVIHIGEDDGADYGSDYDATDYVLLWALGLGWPVVWLAAAVWGLTKLVTHPTAKQKLAKEKAELAALEAAEERARAAQLQQWIEETDEALEPRARPQFRCARCGIPTPHTHQLKERRP